jgi:hypothetical protein
VRRQLSGLFTGWGANNVLTIRSSTLRDVTQTSASDRHKVTEGNIRETTQDFRWKLEGKGALVRPRTRWEAAIKDNL